MSLEIIKGSGLRNTLEQAVKNIRRRTKQGCTECGGRGTATYETYEDGWDRTFAKQTCRTCNGRGTIGGGQPGLHLWFQSVEERDAFRAKVLRMRGIKWTDESPAVLESQSVPKWKDD
jgi:hypothetical protein